MKRSGFKRKTPDEIKQAILNKKAKVTLSTSKGLKTAGRVQNKPLVRRGKSDLSKLKAKLWDLCRQLVKLRHPHVCYTCGKTLTAGSNDFHTGHFISSSICSTALRYDLDNLRPQCASCNIWKSGNWLAFEEHLNRDMGATFTEDLKKRNYATKGLAYKTDWYERKIEEYKALL